MVGGRLLEGIMARPTILVVDDEQDILTAVQAFLGNALNADVITAPGGQQALDKLANAAAPIDLVVSDFRMPGMDGLHFLRRAAEMRPNVPRILMTAFPDMQLAIAALNQAHIQRFLTKPVEPDDLLRVVEETLHLGRTARLRDEALHRGVDVAHRPKA